MKILLLGYGKMGKIIESIAVKRGHEIVGKINEDNIDDLQDFNSNNTDVAIEFSQPDSAYDNLAYCMKNNIPAVCGTTGWLENKHEIEDLCLKTGGAFFYASNYSIGVNLFFKANEYLASLMQDFDDYDISIEEIHHTEKKDTPSGTAITLAEDILENNDRKKAWVNEHTENPMELFIKSVRKNNIPGTHTVRYSSAADTLEMIHTAHSREGFAMGAVLVAEWIRNKTGVLSMDDFLNF